MSGDTKTASKADEARYAGAKKAVEAHLGEGSMPSLTACLAAADKFGGWDGVVNAIARGEEFDTTPSADGRPDAPAGPTEVSWSPDANRDPSESEWGAMTVGEANVCSEWLDDSPKVERRITLRSLWNTAHAEGEVRRAAAAKAKAEAEDVDYNLRVNAERFLVGAGQLDEIAYLDGLASSGLIAMTDSSGVIWEITPLGLEVMGEKDQARFGKVAEGFGRDDRLSYGFTVAGAKVNRKSELV
jgi:hypothetical protein